MPQSTTPFAAKDYMGTYKKILLYAKTRQLKWLRRFPVSDEARDLVEGLLHPDQDQVRAQSGTCTVGEHGQVWPVMPGHNRPQLCSSPQDAALIGIAV